MNNENKCFVVDKGDELSQTIVSPSVQYSDK